MSAPTEAGRRRRTPGAGKAAGCMQTSLSTLTLEVYYRYLPLFKYPPNSWAASNMARMFSGGTLAWMLWIWLNT